MAATPSGVPLPDPKAEPILTVPRVAEILRCSDRAAYTLAEEGGLPVIKIGKRGIRVLTAQFLRQYGLVEDARTDAA